MFLPRLLTALACGFASPRLASLELDTYKHVLFLEDSIGFSCVPILDMTLGKRVPSCIRYGRNRTELLWIATGCLSKAARRISRRSTHLDSRIFLSFWLHNSALSILSSTHTTKRHGDHEEFPSNSWRHISHVRGEF